MNLKYKIATLLIACTFSYPIYAQQVRPNIKQPPRVNGVLKATTNASTKAKIHANSNSVFGPNKTHPKYDKRKVKKEELKKGKEVATNSKKGKNKK